MLRQVEPADGRDGVETRHVQNRQETARLPPARKEDRGQTPVPLTPDAQLRPPALPIPENDPEPCCRTYHRVLLYRSAASPQERRPVTAMLPPAQPPASRRLARPPA